MTAQDLKNSILQLAIQGKLSRQLKTDSSVDEAITNMMIKRNELILSGKLKKEGKINNTTDKNELDIPENWRFVLLKDVICKRVDNRGKTPEHQNVKTDGTIDLLEINSLIPGQYISHERVEKFISPDIYKTKLRGYVEKDDILIATVGSIGKISLMDDTGSAIAQNIIGIRCFSEIDQKYIFYLLQTPYFYIQMNCVTMEAVQASIKVPDLMNLKVPLPPIEEQKRIVAKIEELLPYMEQYEKAYSKLEVFNKKFPADMQKSILQYAIQGKLVEHRPEEGTAEELYQQIQAEKAKLIKEGKIKKEKQLGEITDDEIPFEIPESWKWVYLNDISFVTKLAGFEYTKYMADAIKPAGEVPIIRAKNIKPNRFIDNNNEFISYELSEKLYRCALDKRCVLMTFIGAGIGEVAVFENKKRYHLAPNVAKIVPHLDINDYLLNYFMSPSGRMQIFQYMKQTAQPSLSMETIRLAMVPLPPLSEQKRIVQAIEELLRYSQLLKK